MRRSTLPRYIPTRECDHGGSAATTEFWCLTEPAQELFFFSTTKFAQRPAKSQPLWDRGDAIFLGRFVFVGSLRALGPRKRR